MNIAEAAFAALTLDEARTVIADGFDGDSDISQKYSWAHEVVYKTTGAVVADFLIANPANVRFPYNQLNDNLRQAGNQLEQCLARQDAIFQLEAGCIAAVIDALNSDRIIEIERVLATNEARANAGAVSGNTQVDVGLLVDRKFDIKREVFDYQQKLFSAKGGALNYNERVQFLRQLQADSIRSVIERLESVRVGFAMAGIAKLAKVPTWQVESSRVLLDMVLWIRGALRSLETFSMSEYPVTLTLTTANDPEFFLDAAGQPLTSAKIVDMLKAGGFDKLSFKFTDDTVKKQTAWSNSKSIRLVSFGIGVAMGSDLGTQIDTIDDKDRRDKMAALSNELRRWRANKRLGARIIPPLQVAEWNGGERTEWRPNEVLLDGVVPIAESVDAAALAGLPTSVCANLNPVGVWSITIIDRMVDPNSMVLLSGDRWAGQHSWANVAGFVVTMTVVLKR